MRVEQLQDMLCQNSDVVIAVCPDEPSWLAARAKLVTASAIPCVMGHSAFMGRLRLWYTMMGRVEDSPSPWEDERAMGHDSEAFHAHLHERHTGRLVHDPGDYCIVTNRRYPGIGATLDRLQWDPEKGLGVLEMKWLREFQRKAWDPLPESVLYQVQTQMLVTGLPWASVSAVIGGCKPIVTDVAAHAGVQAGIVRAVAAWMRSLAAGTPPEPTGHESDALTLDEVFGGVDDGVMECGQDLRSQFDEWERVATERIRSAKREEQIKAEIKAAMGSHTRAIGVGYEFKISGKNRVLKRKEVNHG